jgi:hypothetical protein
LSSVDIVVVVGGVDIVAVVGSVDVSALLTVVADAAGALNLLKASISGSLM